MGAKTVKKLVGKEYVPIPFKELKEGDRFKMFNSDGSPVSDGITGNTELIAASDAFEWKKGEGYSIDITSKKEEKGILRRFLNILNISNTKDCPRIWLKKNEGDWLDNNSFRNNTRLNQTCWNR